MGLSNALTDTGICTSIKYLDYFYFQFHPPLTTRWALFNFLLHELYLALYIIYAMALCLCLSQVGVLLKQLQVYDGANSAAR